MKSRIKANKRILMTLVGISACLLIGCGDVATAGQPPGNQEKENEIASESEASIKPEEQKTIDEEPMEQIKALAPVKNPMDHNPVMTQKYSADPYAMEYDGRIYLYMTGDEPMVNADGTIKNNDYSNINTIRIVSSDDLVNWVDHGEIVAAGKEGAANWGGNSWAPAACWKMIDGKPKFFLYFANSGNGIAVLTADSPIGPFTDPLGEAIISRKTPTCDAVTWLFDPAVLIDDDGTGYLYFGGGVPSDDKVSNPGTARVAKLAEDMIHLDGDPQPIENVLYLFEDSGINKVGDKYIYSYCSNFNVPKSGCEGYGFESGEIVTMVSDSPMGPFATVQGILKNPDVFFKYGGNNHHCMFEFKEKWYVTYHASLVEEKLGEKYGYRNVNIDEITIGEDGTFAPTRGTKTGVEQLKNVDPFQTHSFTEMSNQMGISTIDTPESERTSDLDNRRVVVNESGAFIQVTGVDFEDGATKCRISLKAKTAGAVSVRVKMLNSTELGSVRFDAGAELQTFEIELNEKVSDIQDIYFVFDGNEIELAEWCFI